MLRTVLCAALVVLTVPIDTAVAQDNSSTDIAVEIDLSSSRAGAERVRELLEALRRRFDLAPFEYTRLVRIAPNEVPHSHPVLTLNTSVRNEAGILLQYLHEQMHWYLTRLGTKAAPGSPLIAELQQMYPDAPTTLPEGARDQYSTYLHLIVNRLEIETATQYLGRERAVALALAQGHYRWIYRTVVADWEKLDAIYRRTEVAPIRPASSFSEATQPQ